jgi:hypothetical protein
MSGQEGFVDRRRPIVRDEHAPLVERRQFTNSHSELSPPARELALAIDRYKLNERRRFVSYEEMLSVFLSLGYAKVDITVSVDE